MGETTMRMGVLGVAMWLLAGCALPLSDHAAAKLVESLAQDNASGCLAVSMMLGGGALIPMPAVPLMGGSAWLYVGRTNEPGSTVVINGQGCTITHGYGLTP